MKTLGVISTQPELAAALRALLPPGEFRVVTQTEWSDDVARVTGGMLDLIAIDADLTSVEPIRLLEKIRRRLPDCPVYVFAGRRQPEWEEEAYLQGARHIFTKPVRGKLILEILTRGQAAAESTVLSPAGNLMPVEALRGGDAPSMRAWTVLRDYSAVLSHSLCAEALLKQFLLFVRGMLGVNRAAVFLRVAPTALSVAQSETESHRLRSACAIGLPPGLLEHFELTLDAGVGGHLLKHGRILQAHTEEARREIGLRKEFELLGAQVAIPILDRESLVGVAMFDHRLTGEPFTTEELTLLFHLLEQLGMAIRNIWLHDQLAANHDLMADTLGHLSNGCVVVSAAMEILHANQAARKIFNQLDESPRRMEFTDLPQVIGGRVFEALRQGRPVTPFKYRPAGKLGTVYQVSIAPFEKRHAASPHAALVLLEDFTQIERWQKLDVEASSLRLVKLMAERLAHEIGNSIVPLSTHQQLFAQKYRDAEFRASLNDALSDGVRRVSRLVKQMYFLARDGASLLDSLPVRQLIEEAFREAQVMQGGKTANLHYEEGEPITIPACDKNSLRHALAEVMLNALQSDLASPQVRVRTAVKAEADGREWLVINMLDNGSGFTAETAARGHEPFFTTRNVGVGLGLTVCRKIIETHQGRLETLPAAKDQKGHVRLAIPFLPPVKPDVSIESFQRPLAAQAKAASTSEPS